MRHSRSEPSCVRRACTSVPRRQRRRYAGTSSTRDDCRRRRSTRHTPSRASPLEQTSWRCTRSWANASLAGEALSSRSRSGRSFRRSSPWRWVPLRRLRWALARARGHAGRPGRCLAVFAWAIVRLVRPQLQQHRGRGVAVAVITLVMTLLLPIPQFVILLDRRGLGCCVPEE